MLLVNGDGHFSMLIGIITVTVTMLTILMGLIQAPCLIERALG